MNYLLKALVKKLEGEIEVAKANVLVYQRSPAGIGEHPDIVQAIESQIEIIAHAQDKICAIREHFSS
jgi:predicted AAA+ superfamily ATPase